MTSTVDLSWNPWTADRHFQFVMSFMQLPVAINKQPYTSNYAMLVMKPSQTWVIKYGIKKNRPCTSIFFPFLARNVSRFNSESCWLVSQSPMCLPLMKLPLLLQVEGLAHCFLKAAFVHHLVCCSLSFVIGTRCLDNFPVVFDPYKVVESVILLRESGIKSRLSWFPFRGLSFVLVQKIISAII